MASRFAAISLSRKYLRSGWSGRTRPVERFADIARGIYIGDETRREHPTDQTVEFALCTPPVRHIGRETSEPHPFRASLRVAGRQFLTSSTQSRDLTTHVERHSCATNRQLQPLDSETRADLQLYSTTMLADSDVQKATTTEHRLRTSQSPSDNRRRAAPSRHQNLWHREIQARAAPARVGFLDSEYPVQSACPNPPSSF